MEVYARQTAFMANGVRGEKVNSPKELHKVETVENFHLERIVTSEAQRNLRSKFSSFLKPYPYDLHLLQH